MHIATISNFTQFLSIIFWATYLIYRFIAIIVLDINILETKCEVAL
jgi:hypothetical protein